MIALLLLACAGMAFAAARSAAARDRCLNPRVRVAGPSPSVQLLCAIGRRPALLLAGRIGWLVRGWTPAAPVAVPAGVDPAALRAGAVIAFAGLAATLPMLLGGATGAIAALVVVAFGCAAPDLWLRASGTPRTWPIETRTARR